MSSVSETNKWLIGIILGIILGVFSYISILTISDHSLVNRIDERTTNIMATLNRIDKNTRQIDSTLNSKLDISKFFQVKIDVEKNKTEIANLKDRMQKIKT